MWKANKSTKWLSLFVQACVPSLKRKDESLEDKAEKKLKLLEEAFFSLSSTAHKNDTINYQYQVPYYMLWTTLYYWLN